MPPNLDEANRFIEFLAGGGSVTFQTFDDRKKGRPLSKVLHGQLARHMAQLEKLNDQGAGVFVMVNAGDLKGRKTANVQQVRAAFVDLDGAPLEPVEQALLQPHLTVESSHGRYHGYWKVEGIALPEFRQIQEVLAYRFKADPTVKDLPRVMRLPGFWHRKGEPFLSRIIAVRDSPQYKREEFLEAFNIDPSLTWAGRIPEGQRNNELFRMGMGFKNRGLPPQAILERLRTANESKCDPPLPEGELVAIADNLGSYQAGGVLSLPISLLDASEFLALSSGARDLFMQAYRRTMGRTEKAISLIPRDLDHCGFGNPKTLARYRKELIAAGFLEEISPPRYGQKGGNRQCGLYRMKAVL